MKGLANLTRETGDGEVWEDRLGLSMGVSEGLQDAWEGGVDLEDRREGSGRGEGLRRGRGRGSWEGSGLRGSTDDVAEVGEEEEESAQDEEDQLDTHEEDADGVAGFTHWRTRQARLCRQAR